MNFFEQQTLSRKKTQLLFILFLIAVLAIITALYLIASPLWQTGGHWQWWHPEYALIITLSTLTLIAIGALYRIHSLKGGGAIVAKALGGREIKPSHLQGLAEKRLYNVVEEMAIASGVPIPRIFILEQENAINAFAAGYTIHDAAIAVSKGSLEQLTRDELQGVVAHEYSHILNGDMRLNIHLIGILGGILVIATIGRILIEIGARSRGGRNNPGPALILAGLAITAIGYIGVFFGRLIKAAISRQREYLADASAVQFTRNPQGIGGALTKILKWSQGSRIKNPMAEEASHLFFAQAIKINFQALMATHPPLEKRIAAILSIPISKLPTSTPLQARSSTHKNHQELIAQIGQISSTPNQIAHTLEEKIHPILWQKAHEPQHAPTLIQALLLAENSATQAAQLRVIEHDLGKDEAQHTAALTALMPKEKELRWILLQTALPALRENTPQHNQQLLHRAKKITLSDGHLNFMELTIEILLEKWLLQPTPHLAPIRKLDAVRPALVPLLTSLAKIGHPQDSDLQRSALQAAWLTLYPTTPIPAIEPTSYHALRQALIHLASATSEIKQHILSAATIIITYDEHIYRQEKDYIRMIALILDAPIPPL
jgi:Zn-dependent protease with chaperone function